MKRKWAYAAFMLFINTIVWGSVFLHGQLIVNWTDSNPYTFFYLVKDQEISKGEYIVWETRHPLLFDGKPFSIHKKVACMPGQKLDVTPGKAYYCDGQLLGRAKTTSLDGKHVDNFKFSGTIPDEKYFTIGHHLRQVGETIIDDSFDSRYCGFVDQGEVLGIAKPIF